MNWYKIANKIGDLFEDNSNSYLGDKIFKSNGVWLYPFKEVKKDVTEGWYIDWFNNPGSINDIENVSISDKVADFSLNMTPYWEINGINSSSGKIYLTPIEPNPFITGVGAGGATITDLDLKVHTGEYERERVDGVLDIINKKLYSSPSDIAYILQGTVPINFGPNGSQGGWYSVNDIRNNRGGENGLDAKRIMMSDAMTLQKMGFLVPQNALDGSLNTRKWDSFVSGTDEADIDLQAEGEDYDSVITSKAYLLKAVEPKIKERNLKAITKKLDIYNNPTTEKENLLKSLAEKIFNMHHPTIENLKFDVYWHLKERFILMAERFKWLDILSLYENSYDPTNRRYVAWAYENISEKYSEEIDNCKMALLRMEKNEENPEVLSKIFSSLHSIGVDIKKLYELNKKKYDLIFNNSNDSYSAYYIKEISRILGLR